MFSVAAFPAFAAMCFRVSGMHASVRRTFLLATALILSVPGRWTFDTGQLAVLLSIASLAAIHYAPSRPWVSAIALSLACVKPTFGIPLAILLFAGRRTKVVFTAAAIVATGSAVVLGTILVAPWLQRAGPGQPVSHVTSPLSAVFAENHEILNADSVVDPYTSHTRVDGVVVLIQLLGAPAAYWVEIAWFGACMAGCGLFLRRGEAVTARMGSPQSGLMLLATIASV
jgi:hypothetical protein